MLDEINTVFADMPTSIKSFVVENEDMTYTIVLNSRASREQNLLSHMHEISHIYSGDFEKFEVGIIEKLAHNC